MRMSTSSSTIRMSCAMTGRAQLPQLFGVVRTIRYAGFGREYQLYPCPVRFPVFQYELSLVIFHDLLDYGETQTGPLCARRDIRLGQSLAALLRQAVAIVLDDHRGLTRHITYRHANMSCGIGALFGDSEFYRLDRILDDIDQGLAYELRVAANRYRTSKEDSLKGNLWMGGALQEHRLTHNLDQVFRLEHWCGHACEGGEFIDHAADIADVPDNRIGAHSEGFRVLLDLLEISAPQPLRRQLDRGQRVLDLMRDPTCDIGPGRLALC